MEDTELLSDWPGRGEEVYGYRFYSQRMVQYHKKEIIILVWLGRWTVQ